jgi:hypothetical protein
VQALIADGFTGFVPRRASKDVLSLHVVPDKAVAFGGMLMADSRIWGS